MTNLDSLFTETRKPTRARCARCGGEAPVRLQLIVARVTHGGKPKQGENSARSVRLCEKHALELLDKMERLWPI